MTSQAAVHKRNMESSILFMQQEHANTLKGLHEEISTLQKRCSELTFQLNMQGLDDAGKDPVSAEHIKHLENMIDMQRETQHDLEVELDKKDKLIKENELVYKRQKMKHLEEMRHKNKEIDTLKAELESKSHSIAYLTTEYHKLKRLHLTAATSGGYPGDSLYMPAPPKQGREGSLRPRRSHLRKSGGVSMEEELNPVRKSSAKSSSSSRSNSPAEMIRPFVPEESEPEIVIKQQPDPLPPIRTMSGRVVRPQVDVVHVSMHTVTKPTAKLQSKPSRKTREVETLAVDQLSHSDSKWSHRAQESHQSSDFH